jgi:hypothetical protein
MENAVSATPRFRENGFDIEAQSLRKKLLPCTEEIDFLLSKNDKNNPVPNP